MDGSVAVRKRPHRFPRVRSSVVTPIPAGEEEARAFLQERLAFLGKTYTVIDFSFALVSRFVAVPLLGWTGMLLDLNGGIVLSASAIYLVQWLVCRRGRWSERALRLIDAGSSIGAGAVNAGMVFAASLESCRACRTDGRS